MIGVEQFRLASAHPPRRSNLSVGVVYATLQFLFTSRRVR